MYIKKIYGFTECQYENQHGWEELARPLITSGNPKRISSWLTNLPEFGQLHFTKSQ